MATSLERVHADPLGYWHYRCDRCSAHVPAFHTAGAAARALLTHQLAACSFPLPYHTPTHKETASHGNTTAV